MTINVYVYRCRRCDKPWALCRCVHTPFKQPQSRGHTCHWPGCGKSVPPAMWGCSQHWFKLPKALRDRIWRAYRPGQENDMRPSESYMDAAQAAQEWIASQAKPGEEATTRDVDFETDRSVFWILDAGHNPIPATIKEWAEFRESGCKRLELTKLPNCWVSTVFLGTDHGCYDKPLLFETMAFEGDYDTDGCKREIETDRYFTWDEAMAGHKAMVAKLSVPETEVKQ